MTQRSPGARRVDSSEGAIEALLTAGLDAYGRGDAESAMDAWHEVLRRSPGHATALQYIDAVHAAAARPAPKAGVEDRPREAGATAAELLEDARILLRAQDAETAYEVLQLAGDLAPGELEVEGYLDLVRCRLFEEYRGRLGAVEEPVRLAVDLAELPALQLSSDAGFLLSQVDGETTIEQLVSLAGTDPFQALRTLDRLISAGIVEIES